jgi:thymidylate synthase ThyX
MLGYMNRDIAQAHLNWLSGIFKSVYEAYGQMRSGELPYEGRMVAKDVMHKEDARFVIPVSTATERSWWINMRAFRDFLRLRLAPDAEWEIRRLAQIMFNMVYPLMPSLLEDIKEKFE